MGYRKKAKTYTLKWAQDHELHGLEVTLRGLTVGKMLELTAKASKLTDDAGKAVTSGDASDTEEMFRVFARNLIAWNLEDEEGVPVPATYDGVLAQELDFVLALVTDWMEAIAGVDTPLPQPASSGLPALEASLAMEPLSPSLAS